ncbi:MAG: hypothetical protein OEV30_11060 [Ignavibacteria bacterium]|nr:hypothetical protein [Ignavibacteria bacterium]
MKKATEVLDNEAEVLGFLRTQYPIYHQSNIFFRDIQYGIRTMLERKGVRVGYTDAERLARDFAERLEKKKMFVRIDGQSWVVRNEEFRTEPVKRQVPAKPAAKPAAAASGAGLPPLKSAAPAGGGLPPLKSSAPASGGKIASLPPLKSSAPAGGKPAPAAPAAPKPAPAAAQPVPEKKKEAAVAKPPAPGPGGLPPITSSVPAGKK